MNIRNTIRKYFESCNWNGHDFNLLGRINAVHMANRNKPVGEYTYLKCNRCGKKRVTIQTLTQLEDVDPGFCARQAIALGYKYEFLKEFAKE